MLKNNIWKIIWVTGIFVILIIILYLVIDYKVKWESKDLNTYLYFYNCDNKLCTSNIRQEDYYNRLLCENDICPYIKQNINEIVILTTGSKSYIYNYFADKVINDSYIDYVYVGNNYYIAVNENNKYGVIDIDGNILVDFNYEFIDDYKDGYVSIKSNGKYGVINENKNISIDAIYDDVILINDNLFAYRENGNYYITSYDNTSNNLDKKYDYVYTTDNVIFVVSNKKIDILNLGLKSNLIMKIDTFYSYKIEKERETLNIYYDSNYLYFNVYSNEIDYTSYKYDLKNNKIL